jgi:ElaA protein
MSVEGVDSPPHITGKWSGFEALSGREVHDLLKLRQDVFVVEQDCAFGEIDGKDPVALHYFLLSRSGEIAGALRLFAGSGADRPSRIGRVVIAPQYRGLKLGQRLMRDGIEKARKLAPEAPVHLSAQAHLERFYGVFGFTTVSEIYLEDDIPHIDMVLAV